MKEYTIIDLNIGDTTEQLLKAIFPDKSLAECYAIHYIISRINMCSFMSIPVKDETDNYFYKCYLKDYEKIKDKLTDEIIEAICDYDIVGTDIVIKGNKGYNLGKIFDYFTMDKEDAYFEYVEPEHKPFNMLNYVAFVYSDSVLPYLCGEDKEWD